MRTRVVELGSLPVLAPNFSSARGIAISRGITAAIPTDAPYILDVQLGSPDCIPEVLKILGEIRPDLNIPSSKVLDQGHMTMKKPAAKTRSKVPSD